MSTRKTVVIVLALVLVSTLAGVFALESIARPNGFALEY